MAGQTRPDRALYGSPLGSNGISRPNADHIVILIIFSRAEEIKGLGDMVGQTAATASTSTSGWHLMFPSLPFIGHIAIVYVDASSDHK